MKKLLIPIISLILFSGIGLLLAANQGYFGYGVSSASLLAKLNQTLGSAGAITTSVSKVEEHSVCKTVTSNDARLLFIPTRTPAERSTFITNKPSHITLGICGCTTNADCSAGSICSGYSAGAGYCEGEFVYVNPAYCKNDCRDGPTCDPCTGVTNQWDCESQTQGDPGYEFPACFRIPEQPGGTAYCGQEFRDESECNTAPSPCYWVNGTATPGTCVAQTCTTPRGTTVANGDSVTAFYADVEQCGRDCNSEVRTCTNGVLGGTFLYSTCVDGQCPGGPECATSYVGCQVGTLSNYYCQEDSAGSSKYWKCSSGGENVNCQLDSGGGC